MKKSNCFFVVVFLAVSLLAHSAAASNEEIQRLKSAVVKIYTTSSAPDYFTPWSLLNPQQNTGSGAVISGNRILTNAHVVANARYIQAQKNDDPHKYQAQVAFISHEADLAILEVSDAAFYKDLRPLKIGTLPEPLQEVSVYGFPYGGNSLSITKGILSRIEHQYYAHSNAFLLAGQIDAAINPGNSGGPVIVNQEIVGVVMQANFGNKSENQGYFVPPSVIKHVLKDAEDGVYDGMPDLGFRTQDIESPAMKSAFGIAQSRGGALVAKVFEGSPANGIVQADDVILAIDGYDIADDRSIEVRRDLRTDFKYAVDQHHVGDKIKIKFSRAGTVHEAELTAGKRLNSYSLVKREEFDTLPEYFIYGGVVFVPLNMNLIKRWGNDWHSKAPIAFLHARDRWASPQQQELVVAIKVLAADVNLGYHDWKNWPIEAVNGVAIKNFAHFCDLLRNTTTEHVIFRDEDGFQMVINHQQAQTTEKEILAMYQVPSPYSEGLFDNAMSAN